MYRTKHITMNQIAAGNYPYPLYSFTYFLDSMERLGIKNIELWAAGPHLYLDDFTVPMLERMEQDIRRRGLIPICFTPEQCMYPVNIGAREAYIRERSIRYFEKALNAAEILGISRIVVTPGDGYREESPDLTRKHTIENLRYLNEKAKRKNITLLLEHLTAETTNLGVKAIELRRLWDEADCENLICMVDTDMMSRCGETVQNYLDAFRGQIGHVHFIDGMPSGHLVPGDGVLPMEQFLKELDEVEYSGYLSLEILDGRYQLHPEDAVRRSLKWLEERMKDH